MHRASPLRKSQGASRVTAAPAPSGATIVKDIFRTTTTPKPGRTTPFAPNLPAEATKTPASVRKFAPKGAGAGMAGTASQELFKQRIPSPDPALSGAEISKAVPEKLAARKATVYADQYLSHKCPPEFDDDQRRQFFCILDLRRLKFAANEIFAKKDWKLNIINFAKEYEKSRGLIMLRYGLYEFKNVKPSEEVMKRWRKAHGLPEPEPKPEKPAASTANSGSKPFFGASPSKRKADDDGPVRDNTLQSSMFNQNKRRNIDQEATDDVPKFAPTPIKSKRKADEADDDENFRNKLQKATPSAARSRLEGIINNVQSGASTPAGSPLKRPVFGASASAAAEPATTPLFGVANTGDVPKSAFATKSNPYGPPSNGVVDPSKLNSTLFQAGQALNGSKDSVLGSHKFGSGLAPKASNIFGYLSESSANNSGAENGNDDETDSESGDSQPETRSQDVAPSYEPSAAASTGTATPPIAGAGGSSLFGLNKPPPMTSNPFASSFTKSAESQAEKPADSAAKSGLFGRVSFGSNGQPLRETSVEQTPRVPSPAKEAAVGNGETITPAKAPGDFTFNPATTPITFGKDGGSLFSKPTGSTIDVIEEDKNIEKAPATSSSSLFANAPSEPEIANDIPKPLFGVKTSEQPSQALFRIKPSEPSPQPLFGAKPSEAPSQPLFGAKPSKSSSQPLFGARPAEQPAQPLFGAKLADQTDNASQSASQPLFGRTKETSEDNKPETAGAANNASSIFGTQQPASSTTFSFGSTTAPKPLFGEAVKPTETETPGATEEPKNLFGSQSAFGAPATTNGGSTAQKEPASTGFGSQPLFGGQSTNTSVDVANTLPNFGGFQSAAEPPKPASNLFGNNSTSASSNMFGGNNSSAAANPFGTPSTNPFGSSSTTTSIKRSAEDDAQPAKKAMFGRVESNEQAASQPASTSFTFGASQPAAPNNQPEKKSMLAHVTSDAAGLNSPVPGRKILTPKRLRGAGASRQASPSPAPSFEGSGLFGSQAPNANASGNTFANSNASFAFGQQHDASTADNNASSSFTFGQSNTQSNGTAPGGSSFTFGGNPSAPAGGSFTFGAGGNAASNPFGGASGPSTQSFGGQSGTPTPAGSFNFQFGGQGPSTPAPAEQSQSLFGNQANGTPAPTFSFTGATPQPTPQQSSTNLFAPQASAPSIFSGLQAGGNAPGVNSPFPAASSVNTTPANGTPEPQAQPVDGDTEAPQEQISLTQGGPGEEDEEVILEVRARAMNYVAVKPGEDSPSSKSPWQIKGIGPLRLLKHKRTGSVRILLRVEPSGNIGMNKALLPGVDYKADGKTVKVMTSTDDGSGLETWVLQVKKPESAVELANTMEKWKSSNK